MRKKKIKSKKVKEPEDTQPTEIFLWKAIFIVACAIIILASLNMLFGVWTSSGSGWDYHVYMGQIKALNVGLNPYNHTDTVPYLPDNAKDNPLFVYGYPPHTLLLFEFISLFNNIGIYRILSIIAILISSYIVLTIDKKPDYILFGTLLISGLLGLFWNILTGNDSFIFFCFTAVLIYFLYNERFKTSAIVAGLMGSFSTYHIIFSAVFLFVKQSFIERIKLILIAAGTFGALLLGSFVINPKLTQAFFTQLLNTGAVSEVGGMSNPTSYLMFWDIVNWFGKDNIIGVAALSLIFITIVIIALLSFIKRNIADDLKIYCITLLSIFMLSPRAKPYAFFMIIIPLYFLLKDYNYKAKLIAIIITCLIPMVVYLNYWANPVNTLINYYHQTLCLFCIFGFIIIYNWYNKKYSGGKNV